MTALTTSPLFGLALTLMAYEAALLIRGLGRNHVALNPVLIGTVIVGAVLQLTGTPYAQYMSGASALTILLAPATVALAVPLYNFAVQFRREAGRLVIAIGAGVLVATVGAMGIAAALGAPPVLVRSIAAKTTTVAIALGVSEQLGGDPGLTTALVLATGILGAVISTTVLTAAGVSSRRQQGLAMGVAGHGIATAYALTLDAEMGAYAGLGTSVAAVLVGLLLPLGWAWVGSGITP